MNVLVVDDSKAMRLIIQRTLRQAGFGHWTISEAADGSQALAAIRAAPPDLVLSDWNMPEMTGIQLLEALRGEGMSIPFGFITTESTPTMRERATQAGALFLIAKPFNSDQFRDTLSKLRV